MATLVDTVREITSTQGDDYFDDDHIVVLLNQAKNHLIELGTKIERGRMTSLRFLDQLRDTQTITFNALFLPYSDFYKIKVDIPSDVDSYVFLELDELNLSEVHNLYEINHGNAVPTPYEGYFIVYDDKYEFYLDKNTYTEFVLRYIKTHTPIVLADTTISDLSDEAEEAILYYTAYLMSLTDDTIPAEKFIQPYNTFVQDL